MLWGTCKNFSEIVRSFSHYHTPARIGYFWQGSNQAYETYSVFSVASCPPAAFALYPHSILNPEISWRSGVNVENDFNWLLSKHRKPTLSFVRRIVSTGLEDGWEDDAVKSVTRGASALISHRPNCGKPTFLKSWISNLITSLNVWVTWNISIRVTCAMKAHHSTFQGENLLLKAQSLIWLSLSKHIEEHSAYLMVGMSNK